MSKMLRWSPEQLAAHQARRPAPAAKKPAKYGNRKVTTGAGETFDSKREHGRFLELQRLERAGQIVNLRRQVEFELIPPQRRADGVAERAVKYRADFVYEEGNQTIVEDLKGHKTPDYIIKRKLLLRVHGISLKETK